MIRRSIDKRISEAYDEDLTGMQCWIIDFLYRHKESEDIYQRDMEKEFHVRRSTATGILKLMEKKGLIKKEPVSSDGRLKKLVLTEKAVQIHNMIDRGKDEFEFKMREGIGEEELDAFFSVIDKIKKNIE